MHRLMMIIGLLIVLFSALFVVAAFLDLIGGKSDTDTSILAAIVVFFSLTGFGGLYLASSSRKNLVYVFRGASSKAEKATAASPL